MCCPWAGAVPGILSSTGTGSCDPAVPGVPERGWGQVGSASDLEGWGIRERGEGGKGKEKSEKGKGGERGKKEEEGEKERKKKEGREKGKGKGEKGKWEGREGKGKERS